MNTKAMVVIATALLVVSTAFIVVVTNTNEEPSTESEEVIYGSFLDGVKDDDGFGVHIKVTGEDAYSILRNSVIGIDSPDVEYYRDGKLMEAIQAVKDNKTLSQLADSESSNVVGMGVDGDFAFDVKVSTLNNGDRLVEMKLLVNGSFSTQTMISGDEITGMPENTAPYQNIEIGMTISAVVAVVVGGDMIKSVSLSTGMELDYKLETNYNNGKYSGDDIRENKVVYQMIGNLSLSGISSFTDLVSFLLSVESTDNLHIEADLLFSSLETSVNTDNAPATSGLNDYTIARQSSITRAFDLPSGIVALLLSQYGIQDESYAKFYNLAKELGASDRTFAAAEPVLNKFGIEITEQQYDALVQAVSDYTMPEYEVAKPILDATGMDVLTESEYNGFRAITLCADGDISYSNMRALLALSEYSLTPEQYVLLMSILDERTAPDYELIEAAFYGMPPVSEEQYATITAFIVDGTVPEYGTVAPILEMIGYGMDEDMYNAFAQMYTDVFADGSYDAVSPYLQYAGVDISESQYDLLKKMLTDRANVGYSDYVAALSDVGIDLTEEQYDQLMEVYEEIGPDMTSATIYKASEALGIGLSDAQCDILLSIIKDRRLPTFDVISPILETMGITDIDMEIYDLVRNKCNLLATAPGYFSMQMMLEPLGVFVSEDAFYDVTTFTGALRDGLSQYKKGENTDYYAEWKDLSINVEEKSKVRQFIGNVKMPETVQKYVITDKDYSISFMCYDKYCYIENFHCEDDNAQPSQFLESYEFVAVPLYNLIWGHSSNEPYYDFEIDGIRYSISQYEEYNGWEYVETCKAYVIQIVDDGEKECTIPKTVVHDWVTYDVSIDGISAPFLEKLTIDCDVPLYALDNIVGPGKIIINSLSIEGYWHYDDLNIDPDRFEFGNTVNNVVYSVVTEREYDNYGQSVERKYAVIVGFTKDLDSFTMPRTAVVDGKRLTIRDAMNIFPTTVGTVIYNTANVWEIRGVQGYIINGVEYESAQKYGIDSDMLVAQDSVGGLWDINGTLVGFTKDMDYYSVGDNKPSNYSGINIQTYTNIGTLDATSSTSYIRNVGSVDTLIVSGGYFNFTGQLPRHLNYDGLIMEPVNGTIYESVLNGAFYAVSDDGAIYTVLNASNGGYYYGSGIVLEGFTSDKGQFTVKNTIIVDGVIYDLSPSLVDIHVGKASILKIDYSTTVRSIKGVEVLYGYGYYYSFSSITNTDDLESLYNVSYNSDVLNMINRCPKLTYIEFTISSEVPWETVLKLYDEGRSIVARLPQGASFTGTNETVPFDVLFLNVDSRIGEMVEEITFTGKVKYIGSTNSPTMPSNLKKITFEQKVDGVYADAFMNCLNLEEVNFKGGIGVLYGNIAYNCKDGFKAKIIGEIGSIESGVKYNIIYNAGYPTESKYSDGTSVNLSILDLSKCTHIGQVAVGSVIAPDESSALGLVALADNVDVNAIRLSNGGGVFAGSEGSDIGDGIRNDGILQTSGSARFCLYKVEGTECARATSFSGEGIPTEITYHGVTYPVRSVDIDSGYGWTFTNGYMYIPEGVSINSCFIWDSITSIDSDSDAVQVRSYNEDGGLKTVLRENGRLFAFIGTSSTHHYTIPSDLVCYEYEIINMLSNKGITSVSASGINPSLRVYNIDGNYSSIVSYSTLLAVVGNSNSADYTLPRSVTDFYYGSYYLNDRVGKITVEPGNQSFESYDYGGYNTFLCGGCMIKVYGTGDTYRIPAKMTGVWPDGCNPIDGLSEFIDLQNVRLEVEDGNNYFTIVNAGDYEALIYNGNLVFAQRIGNGNALVIPDKVSAVDFTYLNDCGITTITGGKDIVAVGGTITSTSTIESVSIQGSVTSVYASSYNTRELRFMKEVSFEFPNCASFVIKSVKGVNLYYMCNALIYATIASGHEGAVVVDVDKGTESVQLWTINVDAISLPASVSVFEGNATAIVSFRSLNGTGFYCTNNAYPGYQYTITQSGGSYYLDSEPSVCITSASGSNVTVRITAADRHSINDDGIIVQHIDVTFGNNLTSKVITQMRDKVTISYETGVDSIVVGDVTDVWFDDTLGNYLRSINREGYYFDGWYLDEGLTSPARSGARVMSDTTLYAKWTPMPVVTIIIPSGNDQETHREPVRSGTRIYNEWGHEYTLYKDYQRTVPYNNEPIYVDTTLYAAVNYEMYLIWTTDFEDYDYEVFHGMEITIDGADVYIDGHLIRTNIVPGNLVITGWKEFDENGGLIDIGDGTYYRDLALLAIAEERTHTVRLIVDSAKGTCATDKITVRYGAYADLPYVEAKDGYRFLGWVSDFRIIDDLHVYDDTTLFAAFVRTDVAEVTLSFSYDDEMCQMDVTNILRHEGDIVMSLPKVVVSPGFRQEGWLCNGEVISVPFVVKKDCIIEPIIVVDSNDGTPCIVTFLLEDGTVYDSIEITVGSTIIIPGVNPTKASTNTTVYSFNRWDGYYAGQKAYRDVSFTVVFDESVRLYDVNFIVGDNNVKTMHVPYQTVLSAEDFPNIPEKEGDEQYIYEDAWDTHAGTVVTSDLEIKATYIPVVRSFDVKFMKGGLQVGETQSVEYGKNAIPAQVEQSYVDGNDVFVFVGWDPVLGPITDNTVYNAVYARQVTLSFSYDGQLCSMDDSDVKYPVGTTVSTLPSVVPIDGMVCNGWKYNGEILAVPFVINADMEIEPSIVRDTSISVYCTVNFNNYDGTLFKTSRVLVGESIVLPDVNPTRASTNTTVYSFSHWVGYTAGQKAYREISFTAAFDESVRLYDVRFIVGEDTVKTMKVEYETVISANDFPALLEKEQDVQYTYTSSWSEPAGKKVVSNLDIVPVYTAHIRSYDVTFESHGEVFETISVNYGAYATFPTSIPESFVNNEDGKTYVFTGWNPVSKIITGNTVYTAMFQIGEQKTEGSTTTVTVVEGNKTTETIYDNSEESLHHVTVKETSSDTIVDEESNKTTTIDTVKETVKDSYNNVVGSTEKIESNTESATETIAKTEIKTYGNSDEDMKTANVSIDISSKTNDVSTKATIEVKENGESSATAESVIGSTAVNGAANINTSDIDAAIGQLETVSQETENIKSGTNVEKTVTVDVTAGTDDQAKVSIPASAMGAVGGKDASLSVKATVGTIKIDSNAVSHLSSKATGDDASVELSISNYTGDLTEAQKRVVKDHKVIQLSASVGGEYAGRDLGGKATITISYELRDGESPFNITVFFVADDGVIYKRVTTYDMIEHTITFETDHFSYYMVANESTVAESDDADDNNFIMIICIATGVMAAIVIIAAVILIGRRN